MFPLLAAVGVWVAAPRVQHMQCTACPGAAQFLREVITGAVEPNMSPLATAEPVAMESPEAAQPMADTVLELLGARLRRADSAPPPPAAAGIANGSSGGSGGHGGVPRLPPARFGRGNGSGDDGGGGLTGVMQPAQTLVSGVFCFARARTARELVLKCVLTMGVGRHPPRCAACHP